MLLGPWRMPGMESSHHIRRFYPDKDAAHIVPQKISQIRGANVTYLIGRSSLLTEIPGAEGGQRMLLAYRLCTRASSEECSNIGALDQNPPAEMNTFASFSLYSLCFSSFLCLPPTLSPLFSAAERHPPPSLTGVAEIILSDSSSCANALRCLRHPGLLPSERRTL